MEKSLVKSFELAHYADGKVFNGIYIIRNEQLGLTKIGSMDSHRQLYWRANELHRRYFCKLGGFVGAKDAKIAGFAKPRAIDLIELDPRANDILAIETSIHEQLRAQGHELERSQMAMQNNNDWCEFYRFTCDTITVNVNGEAVTLRVK